MQFTALLQKKGVAHMLTLENELDRKVNDPTLPVSAPMTALMKANATAWYLLVSALSGEPFDLICSLPDSHVGKAWKLLTAKYEKEGVTDLPYLLTQLFQCKWQSKDVNPSIWLADMRAINSRIVAAGGQDKTDAEWITLIQSNTAIPEFQQLYTFLNVANKTRKVDWETEICNMWNNQCRGRLTVPTANNNNAELGGFGGLSCPPNSRYSHGKSSHILGERSDRKMPSRHAPSTKLTASEPDMTEPYFLGNVEYINDAEGNDATKYFKQRLVNYPNTRTHSRFDMEACEHKPFQWVTQNGHFEENCPARLYEGRNNEHNKTLLNNHDEVKDYWKTLYNNELTAPNPMPVQNVIDNIMQHILENNPTATEEKKDENDNVTMFLPEGEKLFDNQEQSVPPALIKAGRMAEDPRREIIIPVDKPTIHCGKTNETVITPKGRTLAPNKTLNNTFPPNKAGRTQENESPESLNGRTLAQQQQRQKLRDLRTAIKIQLDSYVHKEVGNLQVGRTRVAASTQSISTQGLAQAQQTLRDLRTNIKIRLDDYVHRETQNQKSLQHLSGTENVKTPPTTLGQVQTS
jgi:hypothetical protein